MTTLHIERELLAGYHSMGVNASTAATIEAHLVRCGQCRSDFGAVAASEPTAARLNPDALWAEIVDRVDCPRRSVLERALLRLGVREATTRLLALTPALRVGWMLSVVLVAAFAALASTSGDGDPWLLLTVAPLIPIAGVATAYGPRLDPAFEMQAATPMSGLRLTLLRSLAVVAATVPILLVASYWADGDGWVRLRWLVPAFVLALAALALSTWTSIERAGLIVVGAWLTAIVTTAAWQGKDHLAADSAFFGPAVQFALIGIGGVALWTLWIRRRQFDVLMGTGGAL